VNSLRAGIFSKITGSDHTSVTRPLEDLSFSRPTQPITVNTRGLLCIPPHLLQ
jgi:hypothetical protein